MTLRSMTGCGSGQARSRGVRAVVELTSVNRRHLEVQIVIPRPLQALEPRIHERVAGAVTRGRVTVVVTVQRQRAGGPPAVETDAVMARAWVDALRALAHPLGLRDDLAVSHLLNLPDLIRVTLPEHDPEIVWPVVDQALGRALGRLNRMRVFEGRALAADLRQRVGRLDRWLRIMARAAPAAVRHHREALRERLRQTGIPVPSDDAALERELALFAERSDISEELTRLRAHLAHVRELLHAREPVGRTLDFLAQELHREATTIAAKCASAEVTRATIEFRAELERFREQVQNVE